MLWIGRNILETIVTFLWQVKKEDGPTKAGEFMLVSFIIFLIFFVFEEMASHLRIWNKVKRNSFSLIRQIGWDFQTELVMDCEEPVVRLPVT
jgi:hypothetical protein